MRRVAQLLFLAGAAMLLMAASAGDRVHRPQIAVPQNPPLPRGLRGSEAATPTPPTTNPASPTAPMKTATAFGQTTLAQLASGQRAPAFTAQTAAAAAAVDPRECRLACAQPYYFCLAGETAGVCPDNWGRCVAACDMPIEEHGMPTPLGGANATAAR